VLELNVTETVETVLVSIIKKSKRIEESKRRLNSELTLESVERSGGLSNLGRCESSSGGDEGCKDKLHCDLLFWIYYKLYENPNEKVEEEADGFGV